MKEKTLCVFYKADKVSQEDIMNVFRDALSNLDANIDKIKRLNYSAICQTDIIKNGRKVGVILQKCEL